MKRYKEKFQNSPLIVIAQFSLNAEILLDEKFKLHYPHKWIEDKKFSRVFTHPRPFLSVVFNGVVVCFCFKYYLFKKLAWFLKSFYWDQRRNIKDEMWTMVGIAKVMYISN